MSAIPVLKFFMGLGFFGFVYWLLDGILEEFINVNYHVRGDVWNLLEYLWVGVIVVYIVFGSWYTIRRYNESQYQTGGW